MISLFLLAGLATDGAAQEGVNVVVEDGVTVVEIEGLHVADSTSWRIDPVPFVEIGALNGPVEYLFGEVTGVLVLPGGEILVADEQALELRVFDRSGQYVRTVGREGDGPGEFREVTDVRPLAGDSVAVLSDGSYTMHIFDPEMRFVRRDRARLPRSEMSIEAPYTSDMLEGIFANGDLFFGDYMSVCRGGDGEVCSDSVRFSRTDSAGEVLARFGTFEWERKRTLSSGAGFGVSQVWPSPQPMWAVGGGRLHFLDQDRREILVFDSAGEVVHRIRIGGRAPDWRRREVFPSRSGGAGDDMPAAIQVALTGASARLQSAPLPDPFASFADMVVDEAGWLWLREYLPPAPDAPRTPRWFVFDREGVLRYAVRSVEGMERRWHAVSLPPAPWIGTDVVLGVTTDDLGVERVVGYRLTRNE